MTGFGRFAGVALCAIVVAGWESKLTQSSYDSVQTGMALSEVEALLGGAGELQTAGGYGVDASGLVSGSKSDTSQKVYVWKEGAVQFVVTFKDDKVVTKSQQGL